MASSFDQWEKDPFFSAAEEVQESADRMESTYRIWIHERNEASLMCDFDELRRDLHAALGTAKWQLEEFERAVESSYVGRSAENARTRHRQFIVAIESKIEVVENSLKELVLAEGKSSLPWISLDDGERDELALFLSSSLARGDKVPATVPERDEEEGMQQGVHGKSVSDCSKNSPRSAEWSPKEAKVERLHGHRRTASASAESADIGAWKIAITDDDFQSNGLPLLPPSNVLFSGFLVILGLVAKLRWSKNVFRKWKGGDRHQLSQVRKFHKSFILLAIKYTVIDYFMFNCLLLFVIFFLVFFYQTELMHATKEARAVFMAMMPRMISNSMVGLELLTYSFKGLNIRSNIIGLFS